jgi:hypothetical protein
MDYTDPDIIEVHEIVKSVEFILASGRTFLIEVAHSLKGTAHSHYGVRYFERHRLYRRQDGTVTAEEVEAAPHFDIWVRDGSLPWVKQGSADAALLQALEFLVKGRNNENPSDWMRPVAPH